jgi:hypothetical protein
MFGELPSHYPLVHGIVWWNIRDPWGSVPLVANSAGERAFAGGIKNSRFAANVFCRLAAKLTVPPAPAAAARAGSHTPASSGACARN